MGHKWLDLMEFTWWYSEMVVCHGTQTCSVLIAEGHWGHLGPRIKLKWNLKENSKLSVQENGFDNVVCHMWAILFQPQCVNLLRLSDAYMRWKSSHHWFRQWLVAWPAPTHYLNQCCNIVNWTFWNKLQWNFNLNSYIFIRENPFENVVWKMGAILSQPQCVNTPIHLCYTADWSHHPLNGSTPPLPRPTWTYMLRTYNKCLRNQEHYFFNTSYFECEKFCTCI